MLIVPKVAEDEQHHLLLDLEQGGVIPGGGRQPRARGGQDQADVEGAQIHVLPHQVAQLL